MVTMENAEKLIREGKYKEAERVFSEFLCEDPLNYEAIYNMGVIYTETGENDKAVKALSFYLMRVETAYAWEALGCANFRLRNYQKALECFNRSAELDGDSPSLLRNMGILHGMTGDNGKCYNLLLQSYEKNQTDFRTLYALSYVHLEFGAKDKARKIMEELLTMNIPEEVHNDTVVNLIKCDLNWN